MSSDVETTALAELCEQVIDCPHSTPVWMDAGVIVLRSSNIKNGRLDLSNPSYTDEYHYQERSKRAEVQAGDLVITREAPMGEVCLIPGDLKCCLGQRMVMLRPDHDRCDGKYLLYALQSNRVQNEIRSHEGTGSTVSNLRIPVLKSLPIPTPDLANQKSIAHILGTLDDKIELNRKTNETLEAMAKALFKSWFVDFDPVRAKAEGRPTGLPAEISDLFPDSFEDSELGEIPSGWSVETVGDISSNFDSKRVPVSGNDREKRKGEYPYYGATGIVDWVDDFLFDGIYLLIGEDGSVERGDGTAFSQYVSGKIWVNNHAHVLTGAQGVSTEHLYLYFQFIQVAPFVTGAVQLKISQGRLNSIPVVVAPSCLNDCFSGLIRKLFDQRIAMGCEMSTLASLRDALLPRLISGEIRIPDAEKMLEEVGV